VRAVVVALLVGCGMDEGRFERAGFERWCTQAANCDGAVQVDVCIERLQAQERAQCTFDASSAQACFDALQSVTCLQLGEGRSVVDVPVDCDQVWTCGGDG
jgi:hypothetical protein